METKIRIPRPYFVFIFILAFILISLNNISAAACTIETSAANCYNIVGGQVVMRLSAAINAHGELATQNNYNYVLCCDLGSGNTTCGANNRVLGLSAATNAHAQIPEYNNYSQSVCYDSLINCFDGSETTLGLNEIYVINLSDRTNAHLGTNYPKEIICEALTAPPPGNLPCNLTSITWGYNEVINGTPVPIIVNGNASSCLGQQISFEVWNGNAGTGTPCSSIPGCVNPSPVTFGQNGTWIANPPSNVNYSVVATVVANPAETVYSPSPPDLNVTQIIPPWCELNVITYCSDYPDQFSCDSNRCGIDVQNSVPSSIDCSAPSTNCHCFWDSNTNTCEAGWTETNTTTGIGVGSCAYSEQTTDTCDDDGYLTVNLTATWVWDPSCDAACQSANQAIAANCIDKTMTVQCPAQIQLPFFGMYNIIAALVIIALIYWAIEINEKKNKKKK